MTDKAIVPSNNSFIAPVADIDSALARYSAFKEFVSKVLEKDKDFGEIPGKNKPTLLKPGAEKLSAFFGVRPIFTIQRSMNDWTGQDHGGEPFFFFEYKCQGYRNGELVGEGVGSCNSWEEKYRYRSSNRKCPQCGKETIIKGKKEYGGGFICFAKKGGCGAKFADDDKSILDQPVGKTANPTIYDQVNTIDKMAQKRALVAMVLITTNASDYFTQDMEDFSTPHQEQVEGEFHEVKDEPKAPPQKTEAKAGSEKITSKMFWEMAKEKGLSNIKGQEVLDKNGGDYEASYYILKSRSAGPTA